MFKSFDRFMFNMCAGTIFTAIQLIFGEVDRTLIVLLVCMGFDMLTGILVGAKNEKLSSKRCFSGLSKKLFILIYIIIANQLDILLSVNYIRVGVCYMYIVNDILSIIENGTSLGVPVPKVLKKALEILNEDKEV